MTLILFPNLLDERADGAQWLPSGMTTAVEGLQGLIAESEKGGRLFLRRFTSRFREVPTVLLNEHTDPRSFESLLSPLMRGETWGLVSDAGLPCVADPGAELVALARTLGLKVEAYAGPSAPLLALILSGLPAQRFAFHGYLAKENTLRLQQIRELERRSAKENATQMFIEAPYRNEKLATELINTLKGETQLCIAVALSSDAQKVFCQAVSLWRKLPLPQLDKEPALFVLYNRGSH